MTNEGEFQKKFFIETQDLNQLSHEQSTVIIVALKLVREYNFEINFELIGLRSTPGSAVCKQLGRTVLIHFVWTKALDFKLKSPSVNGILIDDAF